MDKSRIVVALAGVAVLIGACGGGGDGTGSGAQGSGSTVVVSGQVTFDLVPVADFGLGIPRLDYSSIVPRPARRVTVQVSNSETGALIDTTSTDDEGRYELTVSSDISVRLRVRAESIQTGTPGWHTRVVDNVRNDALFVLEGDAFNSGRSNSTRDLHASSGWTGASYADPRAAAPFAILDAVDEGVRFLLEVEPELVFPPLTVHWSPDNDPVPGDDGLPDPDSGRLGTTFYSTQLGGIFLLGREHVDTEEFDRGVILHEWGHYIEDAFFRSDSIGGPHALGDRLDMRVAFSEGFGSAFAGMVLGTGQSQDTFGPRQGSGFTIEVENVSGLNAGWYSEESIQGILYDLFDSSQDTPQDQLGMGFGPLFDVLAEEFRSSVALTSLFPFVNALKSDRGLAEAILIDDLVATQNIAAIADDFGTNRGTPAPPDDEDVLPIYTDIVVNGGAVQNICSTDAFGSSALENEDVNKLGSRRFLKFTTAISGIHTFRAAATLVPDGATADPDMELHQRGSLLPFPLLDPPGKSDDANTETFSWPLTPGDYVLEVYEWTNTNARSDPEFPPIGRTCFEVEVTTP